MFRLLPTSMKLQARVGIILLGAGAPISALGDSVTYAHRGACAEAPENTLLAFEMAWELGADGIECDFRMTKDGIIVCIHNATTHEASGGAQDLVVAESTFADLRKIDLGGGQRISSLQEVLAKVPDGRKILIDIKCTDQEKGILDPRFIPALAHALGNSALPAEDISVICFHRHVIAECRRKLPGHEAIWLIDPRKRPPLGKIQAGLKASGASGIGFPAHPEVARDPGLRAAIRILGDQGFSLLCWTLDDQDEGQTALQFVGLGAGIVVTNDVEKVRTALAASEVREPAVEKQ